MNIKDKLLLIIILVISVFFRFYLLNEVPNGLHADGASQGFNAYSLLKTGKDMYGKTFPILFRANGSYQPPVYTYLTMLPVFLFGNTVFSARFISALAGSILVLLTFIFVRTLGIGNERQKITQGLFSSLIVSISPWAMHFSRLTVEGNLVVPIFVSGVLLLGLSAKNRKIFIPACIVLGLSTHVYYTERITSLILIPIFLFVFKERYKGRIKEILIGLFIVFILLLPHLYLMRTGALTRRLTQVSYLSDENLIKGNGINKIQIISKEYLDHYFYYLSPKNLFIDSGQNLGRTSFDLSVFYPWFLIPLLFGISYLTKNKDKLLVKLLTILLIIGPLPAAITGDLFYPLRVLSLLWTISVVISFGVYYIWEKVGKSNPAKLVLIGILIYSYFLFYTSYFVQSRYESNNDLGYSYIKLIDKLKEYPDKNIVLDYTGRAWGAGIRMVYLMYEDPLKVQNNLSSQLKTSYYSPEVNAFEIFNIGNNITVRSIEWKDDLCLKDTLFVGDQYFVDKSRIEEMGLREIFSVMDIRNNPTLFGYVSENKNCSEIR